MSIVGALDSIFDGLDDLVKHRGTIALRDSHGVAGTLRLAAELSAAATSVQIEDASGGVLDGRIPSGLSLTIGGDSYKTSAEADAEDGAITLTITPAATTTYAAASAVVLSDYVETDLAALGAEHKVSGERREPGTRRSPDHQGTVYILQSRLAKPAAHQELEVDGEVFPIRDVTNAAPHWGIVAGRTS